MAQRNEALRSNEASPNEGHTSEIVRARATPFWLLSLVAPLSAAAVTGCSPAYDDPAFTTTGHALSSTPPDPMVFCLGSGITVILGNSNDNTLNGTPNADCIVGLGGQDIINGNGGNDLIFGGDGDDVCNGGPGDDQIFAGSGQDNVNGNNGNDLIFGEDGDDTLNGNNGADSLSGGQGQDRVFGGADNDSLVGDAGDDRLDGGAGNDNLSDCTNHNVFVGGGGTNICQGSSSGNNSSTFNNCQTRVACNAPSNDWPQFQHDPAHSGINPVETAFTPAALTAPLDVAFKAHFSDGGIDVSGPVESNGVLYIGDSGTDPDFAGRLSAFNAAGCGGPTGGTCEPIWQGLTGGNISNTPAVANGFVMVASRAATGDNPPFLFGFDATGCGLATCEPVWRGVLADAVVGSSPAVSNGIAYVGDFGGRLYAFDVVACGAARNLNCQPIWTGQAGPLEQLTTSPIVGPNYVIISSLLADPNVFTGRLNAFARAGCGNPPNVPCAPAWTADIGGPGTGQTLSGRTVFVGSGTLFGEGENTNFHVLAFNEAGCGAPVCSPLRVYDTGDVSISEGALGTPVVVGDTLLVSTQNTPAPGITVGVVSAYSAGGITQCAANQCEPIWTGINFASGFETSPAVAGNVVFVGKNPADGFQTNGIDAGVYAYDLRGCGAGQTICLPLSLTQVGLNQFNLGAPLAIARGTVFYASNDNDEGQSHIYALKLP